jgi:hypothetical protein
MIRAMTLDDVEGSMPLFEAHHRATGETIPFDLADAAHFVCTVVNSPKSITLLKIENAIPVGVVAFVIVDCMYNHQYPYAAEVFWYAYKPKVMVELWEEAEKVLKDLRINRVQIGIPVNGKIQKWLARRGFKPIRIGLERSE